MVTNVMTSELDELIKTVYNRFLDSEDKRGWSSLDDYLDLLEYLDDHQLYKESLNLYNLHKNKKMGCPYNHKKKDCFVPSVLTVIELILIYYAQKMILTEKYKFILQYYLALTQCGQIIELINAQGHDL